MNTREFDPAELIDSEADVLSLLEDAFNSNDAAYIAAALGTAARAKRNRQNCLRNWAKQLSALSDLFERRE